MYMLLKLTSHSEFYLKVIRDGNIYVFKNENPSFHGAFNKKKPH